MTDFFTTIINGLSFEIELYIEPGYSSIENITLESFPQVIVPLIVYDDIMTLEDSIIENFLENRECM